MREREREREKISMAEQRRCEEKTGETYATGSASEVLRTRSVGKAVTLYFSTIRPECKCQHFAESSLISSLLSPHSLFTIF